MNAVLIVVLGLLGLSVTVLVGDRLSQTPGVYWSESRVTILPPQSTANPNMFELSLRSISMTAGIVANMVGDDQRRPRAVAPEMPLPELGVRSGWSVEQPDRGGQWSHQYSDPYITIQAVDPDPDRVAEMMAALEEQVRQTLTQVQDDAHVAPVNRFTTTTSPPTINVKYQGVSRWRALLGTYLLGAGITALVVRLATAASRGSLVRSRSRRRTTSESRDGVRPAALVDRAVTSPSD